MVKEKEVGEYAEADNDDAELAKDLAQAHAGPEGYPKLLTN